VQLLPWGFRSWPTGGCGVLHGQACFWSGTANMAWGRIRAPRVRWPWGASSIPTFPASHPAPLRHPSRFSQRVSNGGCGGTMGSWERWRCPRTVTVPRPPTAARCVPFSPRYGVSVVLGVLSLAPMGAEETWNVHGQQVHDPAPTLGAGMGRHISTHCGIAWPWWHWDAPSSGWRAPTARCHPAARRPPAASRAGAAATGAGLSIPAAARDRGPAPAPPALPGCRASSPACPPHRPPGRSRRVPSHGGPLEMKCSYWGILFAHFSRVDTKRLC